MSDNDDLQQLPPPRDVVIAGAGMMGVATAYYLATQHFNSNKENRSMKVTLVDPTGTVAPAASGKAGGFLALDWNDGGPTEELTRRSFQLHQELADTLGAESIQYRRLTCVAVTVREDDDVSVGARQYFARRPFGKKLAGIEWAQQGEDDDDNNNNSDSIRGEPSRIVGVRNLGDEATIAQVHPRLLCERLWEETCKIPSVDATMIRGRVVAPVFGGNNGTEQGGNRTGNGLPLSGVRIAVGSAASSGNDEEDESETVISADALVLACGPWTTNQMLGIKYHSVIVPTSKVLKQCVFFSGYGDPEVYVRPDSTAYCTGFPETARVVLESPGQEHVDPELVARILDSVRRATTTMTGGSGGHVGKRSALSRDPVVQQACYLPTTRDGIPVVGQVPSRVAGGNSVYVCAGHTCWGILLGPASGEAVASLVMTGRCPTVDLRHFEPGRLGRFKLLRSDR
jgi:glycine/D-amino acid oxidase-like deaminating enzyme